jgi:hypothetical protein
MRSQGKHITGAYDNWKTCIFYARMTISELGTLSVSINKNYMEALRSKYVQSDHVE